MRIGTRQVGPGQPVFVVAEAGSNHNGSLELARKLVDVAASAGADAVKFQTFRAERLYPRSAGRSEYLGLAAPIFDVIAAMEMPESWLGELSARARAAGLAFFSSPFHEEAVAVLAPHVDAFKIASYELTHEPLLRAVAAAGKPVVLSTGASTLEEIRRAVDVLRAAGCNELVVLQCTAAYPAPPETANVRALVELRDALGVPVGLSDHTREPTHAPAAAVALGATLIEKHFTTSRALPGPDHAFAIEPDELAQLVAAVRGVERVLGDGRKDVQAVEGELRHFARRSVFTTRAVKRGEPFTRDNVDVLRAGQLAHGLAPSQLPRVLASRARRDVPAETALNEADLEEAPLELRDALPSDRERLLEWANDPATRAASFSSALIGPEEHASWFESSLANAQRRLFIACCAGMEVGVVRIDRDGRTAEVSLQVAPVHRGRGLARAMLAALDRRANELGVRRWTARVKPANLASLRAFEAAGYRRLESAGGVVQLERPLTAPTSRSEGEFDAVVLGASTRGLVAARTLDRLGLRAALIEGSSHVGGADASFAVADGTLFEFGMHVLDEDRSPEATRLFADALAGEFHRVRLRRAIAIRGHVMPYAPRADEMPDELRRMLPRRELVDDLGDELPTRERLARIYGREFTDLVFDEVLPSYPSEFRHRAFGVDESRLLVNVYPWFFPRARRAPRSGDPSRAFHDRLRSGIEQHVLYPRRGGFGGFTQALLDGLDRERIEVLVGAGEARVELEPGTHVVRAVHAAGREFRAQRYYWAGAWPRLCEILALPCQRANTDQIVIGSFRLDRPAHGDYHEILVGDPALALNRVDFPARFRESDEPLMQVEFAFPRAEKRPLDAAAWLARWKSDLTRLGVLDERHRVLLFDFKTRAMHFNGFGAEGEPLRDADPALIRESSNLRALAPSMANLNLNAHVPRVIAEVEREMAAIGLARSS